MSMAATVLGCSIVVFDDRDRLDGLPGVLTLFTPATPSGVSPYQVIGKVQARELFNKKDDTLWVHLTPGHYTMLECRARKE